MGFLCPSPCCRGASAQPAARAWSSQAVGTWCGSTGVAGGPSLEQTMEVLRLSPALAPGRHVLPCPQVPQSPKPSRAPRFKRANPQEEDGKRVTRGEDVLSQSLLEVAFKQMEEWSRCCLRRM